MEPLSWGTGHADILTVQAMLKDAGYDVPEINMDAYMKVRSLTQEFIDDFLGYYISPKNRLMNSLLIGPGLPGGMMGSLMADLEDNLVSINRYFTKNNKPTITQDDLLIELFNEVAYVWPRVGYPPLVTPFSQYVKNLSLMNVMSLLKGKDRWGMIADDIWDMLLGKSGKLPGPLAPEIVALAEKQGRQFFTGNPQDLYPDALPKYRDLMQEKGWPIGEDDEELFEYAMHPAQYEAYKSGKAKADFEADIDKRKAEKFSTKGEILPQTLIVEIDGEKYSVNIAPDDGTPAPLKNTDQPAQQVVNDQAVDVISPLEGKFFLTKGTETGIKAGDKVNEGDVLCYVEAMKTYNGIMSPQAGTVAEICFNSGDKVYEDDVLIKLS